MIMMKYDENWLGNKLLHQSANNFNDFCAIFDEIYPDDMSIIIKN